MPRGKAGSGKASKSKSIDSLITENDALIESLQKQLASAKAKKKELIELKNKADLDAIQKIIVEKGITAEELKALIEKAN